VHQLHDVAKGTNKPLGRSSVTIIGGAILSTMKLLPLDNYGTHKTALIRNWLTKRLRFHVHFTSASASWINLVERWFAAALTKKQIRHGSFRSTGELEAALKNYVQVNNHHPKPFVWTKSADQSSTRSPDSVDERQEHDTSGSR
jgi:hypothetical protein